MEKKNKKTIEIPFGGKDSELYKFEYAIPEGMEAIIDGNKVIIRKKASEDERIRKSLVEYFRKFTPENMWDEMFSFGNVVSYLEKMKERGPLSKDEEYTLARIIEYLEDNDCPSAWKDLLHDVYSLPYQKEQKPSEWSEEDRKTLDAIIKRYSFSAESDFSVFVGEDKLAEMKKEFEWLRNLQYKCTWKPSEEQINAVSKAIEILYGTHYAIVPQLKQVLYELGKLI